MTATEQPGTEQTGTEQTGTEQTGTEQTGNGKPGAEAELTDAAETDAQPELDDVKRKFREALERKRGNHASAKGADNTGKVHGSHGPAASRRSFRRKSG